MRTELIPAIGQLTDNELLERVHDLVRRERVMTTLLVAHLAEFDRRSLYLSQGCSSLFTYCTRVLHLGEHAAYNRIQCARVVGQFPGLIRHLLDGSINVTTLRLLSRHLTPSNWERLIDEAHHKGKHDVERLVAAIRPLPDVPTTIRRLPERVPRQETDSAPRSPEPTCPAPTRAPLEAGLPTDMAGESVDIVPAATPTEAIPPPAATPTEAIPPPPPARIVPLAPHRYRVQFTASEEMHQRLCEARELLRHQIPDGNPVMILDRALIELLKMLHRRKHAATDRPREPKDWNAPTVPGSPTPSTLTPSTGSRRIPARVQRQVWSRDDGKCTFRSSTGHRCEAEGFLEYHHLEPFAVGGSTTVENLTLRCRAHNSYEARQTFGAARQPKIREAFARYQCHQAAT